MARKRMIDPEFWRDEKIAQLKHMERLLFIGLWNYADDEGYGRASPTLLKADIFPYDVLKASEIEAGLANIAALDMIILYSVGGQSYYQVVNFKKHQTINRPTKSVFPRPDPSLTEHSLSTHGVLTESSLSTHGALTPNIKEEKIKEDKRKENNTKEKKSTDVDAQVWFERFWTLYPKKTAKKDAIKAWSKIRPEQSLFESIIAGVERWAASEQWRKDNGQYIPNPATFLNGERWNDECKAAASSAADKSYDDTPDFFGR